MPEIPPSESYSRREGTPDRRTVTGWFQRLAPRYNSVVLGYTLGQDLRWKRQLVRGLHPRPGDRALDLACGTGMILERLGREVGDSRAVGADINRPMLLEAARSGRGNPIVQADAEHLPFAAGSFDVVTAGFLLKYLPLERFLPEVARVLRPGGRFGAYDFARPRRGTPTGNLYSIYLNRVLPAFGRGSAPGTWREVFSFLPEVVEASSWESTVSAELDRAGFEEFRTASDPGGTVIWVWARRTGVRRPEDGR